MKRGNELGLILAVGVVFGLLGVGAGWWWQKPPTPWLAFESLHARYEEPRPAVLVSGSYRVNKHCGESDVIWRIEAVATDGQVAQYGPEEPTPSLSPGQHWLETSIPLEAEIHPDGWQVRILVTCPGRTPETVASPPALVDIGNSMPPAP